MAEHANRSYAKGRGGSVMIRAMKRKLKSQRGASLLLALLFFLICTMVSSSILMAAVSNAGKHQSNLEEHQTYLALSSAVNVLCDELNRTEYQGQYQYQEVIAADGNTARHFVQLEGAYQHKGTDKQGYLQSVLLSDFDAMFAKEIQEKLNPNDFQTFEIKSGAVRPHNLTVTPQTGTELDDNSEKVKMQLNVVEDSYAVEVTATLNHYQIKAELTPITNKPTLPMPLVEGALQETDPLQWKIGWITTGEEEVEP